PAAAPAAAAAAPAAAAAAAAAPAAAAAAAAAGGDVGSRALEILRRGYGETRSFGSSTALVVLHEGQQQIGIANVGDSALILLRRQLVYRMTCVFRTAEQQHEFNCPFQLSRLPQPGDYELLRCSGKQALLQLLQRAAAAALPQDTPEAAAVATVAVQEGDLLLLGTDGLFDNLFDHEICAIASFFLSPKEAAILGDPSLATSATDAARAIGEAAAHRSRSSTERTPFMKHARQEGAFFTGGKMDDITVVACWVTSPDSLLSNSEDISGFQGAAAVSRDC
ncbi:hypothetical protein, conserved, partial [Eimeria necatrix]